MQYIRITTKQEAIEAETPEEAQTGTGKTIDITVRVIPRPTPSSTLQRPSTTPALEKRQAQ